MMLSLLFSLLLLCTTSYAEVEVLNGIENLDSFSEKNIAVQNDNMQLLGDNVNKINVVLRDRFSDSVLQTTYGGTSADLSAVPANNLIYTSSLGTFGNIGIGTTSALLTWGSPPTWVVPNPAFTLVSKTTLSAATNSGDIPIVAGNYYKIIFQLVPATSSDIISFRFNNDTGATYAYAFDGRTTGGSITGGATAATSIILGTAANIAANGAQINGSIEIFPQAASIQDLFIMGKVSYINSAATLTTYVDFTGSWNNAAAATSFRMLFPGGVGTLTGNIFLYKYSQS